MKRSAIPCRVISTINGIPVVVYLRTSSRAGAGWLGDEPRLVSPNHVD